MNFFQRIRSVIFDLRMGAILSGTVTVFAVMVLFESGNYHLPDNQQGYAPVQPVKYSHKVHAGDNQIPCLFCHHGAETSRMAGIPSADVCMKCHTQIMPDSPEVQKITQAVRNNEPVQWVRIHKLPDFVRFSHSSHVNVGVACQQCHGGIETMERVAQFAPLDMGWCVNCHREYNENPMPGLTVAKVSASIDCGTCHY